MKHCPCRCPLQQGHGRKMRNRLSSPGRKEGGHGGQAHRWPLGWPKREGQDVSCRCQGIKFWAEPGQRPWGESASGGLQRKWQHGGGIAHAGAPASARGRAGPRLAGSGHGDPQRPHGAMPGPAEGAVCTALTRVQLQQESPSPRGAGTHGLSMALGATSQKSGSRRGWFLLQDNLAWPLSSSGGHGPGGSDPSLSPGGLPLASPLLQDSTTWN